MKKTKGHMTSERFYNLFLDCDIVTRSKVQYYRGAKIVITDEGSELHTKLVKEGILLTPVLRKCLRCDNQFHSLNGMRMCNQCKKNTKDYDGSQIYYTNGDTL